MRKCFNMMHPRDLVVSQSLSMLHFIQKSVLLFLELAQLAIHVLILHHCSIHTPLISGLRLLKEPLHGCGLKQMRSVCLLLDLLIGFLLSSDMRLLALFD